MIFSVHIEFINGEEIQKEFSCDEITRCEKKKSTLSFSSTSDLISIEELWSYLKTIDVELIRRIVFESADSSFNFNLIRNFSISRSIGKTERIEISFEV